MKDVKNNEIKLIFLTDKDLVWALSSRDHVKSVVMDNDIEDTDSSSDSEEDFDDDYLDEGDVDDDTGSNSTTDNEKHQNIVTSGNGKKIIFCHWSIQGWLSKVEVGSVV